MPISAKSVLQWFFDFIFTTRRRKLEGLSLIFAKCVAASMASFYLYTSAFGVFSPESHRGVIFTGAMMLCFMLMPGSKNSPLNRITAWDCVLIAACLAMGIYLIINYPQLVPGLEGIPQWTA